MTLDNDDVTIDAFGANILSTAFSAQLGINMAGHISHVNTESFYKPSSLIQQTYNTDRAAATVFCENPRDIPY